MLKDKLLLCWGSLKSDWRDFFEFVEKWEVGIEDCYSMYLSIKKVLTDCCILFLNFSILYFYSALSYKSSYSCLLYVAFALWSSEPEETFSILYRVFFCFWRNKGACTIYFWDFLKWYHFLIPAPIDDSFVVTWFVYCNGPN